MGTGQGFSTRLINRLGSGREILNPFKFDTNTNPTQHDLLPRSNYNAQGIQVPCSTSDENIQLSLGT